MSVKLVRCFSEAGSPSPSSYCMLRQVESKIKQGPKADFQGFLAAWNELLVCIAALAKYRCDLMAMPRDMQGHVNV